jgi:hypothetical protein
MPAKIIRISERTEKQLIVRLLSEEESLSDIARQTGMPRNRLKKIKEKAEKALQKAFSQSPKESEEGYWVKVDPQRLRRTIIQGLAEGQTQSQIVAHLRVTFDLQISEETVRQVAQQAYQKSYEYQNSVDLSAVQRTAFDEMIRYGRWILTGVDPDSLFIFLHQKQPSRNPTVLRQVLQRLQQQGLNPQQQCLDGSSLWAAASRQVWPDIQVHHDRWHASQLLHRLLWQYEGYAYRMIHAADQAFRGYQKGATSRTSLEKLEEKLNKARQKEAEVIDQADTIAGWVEQAHAALALIDPATGKVNKIQNSIEVLAGIAAKIAQLPGTRARWASSYLKTTGAKLVEQQQAFIHAMMQVASAVGVAFEVVEAAALFWQLSKQYQAAKWHGTKEALLQQMWRPHQCIQQAGKQGTLARDAVVRHFCRILTASSAAEWVHSQVSPALSPHKRVSSGMLHLRTAYLNLHTFQEGKRQGKSPHELLTGEPVVDWLTRLGYPPTPSSLFSFKSLGWSALVSPFEATFKQSWCGRPSLPHSPASSLPLAATG